MCFQQRSDRLRSGVPIGQVHEQGIQPRLQLVHEHAECVVVAAVTVQEEDPPEAGANDRTHDPFDEAGEGSEAKAHVAAEARVMFRDPDPDHWEHDAGQCRGQREGRPFGHGLGEHAIDLDREMGPVLRERGKRDDR